MIDFTLSVQVSHSYQLFVKLHRVQEPIHEHDVRVISIYKQWVCKQFVANHLHRFFNEHKGCSQFSGYDVRPNFPDSQNVKALQGPLANKIFASVYAA